MAEITTPSNASTTNDDNISLREDAVNDTSTASPYSPSPLETSQTIPTPSPSPYGKRSYDNNYHRFLSKQSSQLFSSQLSIPKPSIKESIKNMNFSKRHPIISNEIWKRAKIIEQELKEHKIKYKNDAKFHFSYLLSLKKLKKYSEAKKNIMRNDPIRLAAARRYTLDAAAASQSQIDMNELIQKMNAINHSKV